MDAQRQSKPSWIDWSVCIIVGTLITSLPNFLTYWPAIRSLQDPLLIPFLLDRLGWAIVFAYTFHLIFFFSTIKVFSLRRIMNLVEARPVLGFLPYTLTVLSGGVVLFHPPANTLQGMGLLKAPLYSDVDSGLWFFYAQTDLSCYLIGVAIGYLFMILYPAHNKRFAAVIEEERAFKLLEDRWPANYDSNRYMKMEAIESPEDFRLADYDTDRLIDEAENLANTYAYSPEAEFLDEDPVEIEFHAFVYGEGLDYVVLDGGNVAPFVFVDEGPADLYDGIFLQINKALYIRYDHIIVLDFFDLYIVISPELTEVFNNITKKNVKDKLRSYRFPGTLDSRYWIDPSLVKELKRRLKVD